MEDIFDFVSNQKVDQDDENLSCKIYGNLFFLSVGTICEKACPSQEQDLSMQFK